jgi:hypothetical protein
MRGPLQAIRAHRGLLMLALLVGSSVLYVACGGSTEHTFQEGDDDTGSPGGDGTTDGTNKDGVADDSPSSNG